MKKTVFLMRHGAAESKPGQRDVDRNLIPAGILEVDTVLQKMARSGFNPDLVLVSPVQRAVQTAERARLIFAKASVHSAASLHYDSLPSALLNELMAWDVGSLLAIGHQPLIGDVVQMWTKTSIHVTTGSAHQIEIHSDTKLNLHFIGSIYP